MLRTGAAWIIRRIAFRFLPVGKSERGKDANGFPLALHTIAANLHEVAIVRATINKTFTLKRHGRITGDCTTILFKVDGYLDVISADEQIH